MRVLLVSRELAGFYGGGIGTYALEMSRLLASRGHETHLLTGPHEGLANRGREVLPGVQIHMVDLQEGRAALDAYPTFPMRYAMAVHERVRSLSGAAPFDYIEFPDYHAEGYFAIAAKRSGGAYAATTLGVRLHSASFLCREADNENRLDVELATIEHMERQTIAGADLLIAPGHRVLERSPPALPGHAQRREVLPVPLDVERLEQEFGGAKGHHGGQATPTVLFFGKLQFLKGPQDLVEAALILLRKGIRARFHFIGNDSHTAPFGRPMLDFLKRRIPCEHAGAFSFEGARPRHELGRAIRDATICVFPSRWEAFPMVCLEAMTLGSPVVGSDVGGLAEIIEPRSSGLLFPAGDASALAGAIEELLLDQPLREALAARGQRRVQELCEPSKVLDRFERIIESGPRAAVPSAHPGEADGRHPAISVIIPFYNLAAYLPETLESVERQTFRDFEVVVIDDGSTDPQAIELLQRLPPRVRVVRKPNGGLGSARNAGLREAGARWVVPLDADDLLEPDTLARLIEAAERNPGAAYISPLVRYFNDPVALNGPTQNGEMPQENTGGWIPLGLVPDLLPILNVGGAASGSLIVREHALAAGGWDETMPAYEDWEFWCRLHGAGHRGVILPEFLLRYRVRANSMFRSELSRHLALHSYILRKHPTLINERTARLLASRSVPGDAEAAARQLVAENIRYRLADRLNDALKRVGVQRAVKAVTRRAVGP